MKQNIINDLRFFHDRIHANELKLERAKVLNEQITKLNAEKVNAELLLQKICDYIDNLSVLKSMSISESKEFKKRRLSYLEEYITKELEAVFPNEHFVATIITDFKYGSDKAYLRLKDQYGKLRIPKMSEGKLYQYVISFASTIGTTKGLGKHNIYIDEAFGVASTEKLTEINEKLNEIVQDGMQIILVSQRSDLYQGIPRREFRLLKYFNEETVYDSTTNKMVPVSVTRIQEVVDIS